MATTNAFGRSLPFQSAGFVARNVLGYLKIEFSSKIAQTDLQTFVSIRGSAMMENGLLEMEFQFMENKTRSIFIALILGMMTACAQDPTPIENVNSITTAEASTPTQVKATNTKSAIKTPEFTSTPRQSTPTATKEPVVVGKLMDNQLPDLLLGTDRGGRTDCKPVGNAEIWLASYPYDQPRILVSDPEADLRFPRWSPEGEWIAYVESKPGIISDWLRKPGMEITGSDSVWLIRPDGTDKHKISDDYPTFLGQNMNGTICRTEFEIASNMTWSPDGKYLVYTYSAEGGGYFIFDINTGITKKIISTAHTNRHNIWTGNGNQFYLQGSYENKEYFLVTIDGSNKIMVTPNKIQFPEKMAGVRNFDMVTVDGGNSFFVIFHLADPDAQSVWRYEVNSQQWESIKRTNWIDSMFLPEMVVIQKSGFDHSFDILDPIDLKTMKTISYGQNYWVSCFFDRTCKIYIDATGTKWGIFSGDYISKNDQEHQLWAIPLFGNEGSQEVQPELLMDLSKTLNQAYLSDYSFKP